MNWKPRLLFIIVSLLLLSVYIWPIWEITLYAPQYPDGVHMYIYVDKIGGSTPGTLQNVNILNHYIGMKKIEPDSIPELRYMPIIVFIFVLFGLLAAWLNNKMVYLVWTVAFIITLLIGFYDFYLWEYDYGHDLDPNAPMKFEGASFQPPLIGKKEIITFTAYSLPQTAGYFVMLAALISIIATRLSFYNSKQNNDE